MAMVIYEQYTTYGVENLDGDVIATFKTAADRDAWTFFECVEEDGHWFYKRQCIFYFEDL